MTQRMLTMLIAVAILFTFIFGLKMIKGYWNWKTMMASQEVGITVSTLNAKYQKWQPHIRAAASLRAVRGVDVTTELAGLVRKIYFTPGTQAKAGQLLVDLNFDSDLALLHSLQANANLAKITYNRDVAQYAIKAVSKQTVDTEEGNLKSLQAQVEQQAAIVAKKRIRAPFSGNLGVSAVNPGQNLNPGDKVVTLQALDPIWVDFYVPQQQLVQLANHQPVTVTLNTYPNKIFSGKITTIDPKVDPATRNVQVEATISNPKFLLLPGMFATAEVSSGKLKRYITLPQTAISFNSYGDTVYIVKNKGKDKKGHPILIATQVLVTVGETRGDQVAIVKGIKEGETVVTAGQLKLKNGDRVLINNSILPSNNPAPKIVDS